MLCRPLFLALTGASLLLATALPAFADQSDQRIVCAVGSNFGDNSSVAIVAGAVPTFANQSVINKQCRLIASEGNWNAISARVVCSAVLYIPMCIFNFSLNENW